MRRVLLITTAAAALMAPQSAACSPPIPHLVCWAWCQERSEVKLPPPTVPLPVTSQPARGLNLGHTACPFMGHGIISRYDLLGVRDEVRAILARKHSEGYVWLRHLVWWSNFIPDPVPLSWGPVPTGIPEPYYTNLRHFLEDARDAGFSVEIAFGPAGANNPLDSSYDPSTRGQNLQTIVRIHDLAESVDSSTIYDLQNEAGHLVPESPVAVQYAAWLWQSTQWRDATVSFVGGVWQALIAAIPNLPWYEVHVYGSFAPFDVPPGGKPVVVGEHFADVFGPWDSRVTREAYWPLASTGADTSDVNCTTTYTP